MMAPRKTCADCGYFFDASQPGANMDDLGWKQGTFCLRYPPETSMVPVQNEFTKQMAAQPVTIMNMVSPNMPACGEFTKPEIIEVCDSCLAHVSERFPTMVNREMKMVCVDCRDCFQEGSEDGIS